MKRLTSIPKKLLLPLLGVLLPYLIAAQEVEQIQILNAEDVLVSKKYGPDVSLLRGNVRFKHKGAIMFCDSAVHHQRTNNLDAYGKIHVKQGDSINIYGDTLHYDGVANLAKLRGQIRMLDNDIELTTTQMDYDRTSNKVSYYSFGKVISRSNQNILTSKAGFYFADAKELFFRDSVRLTNPQYVMASDTLKYNTQSETAFFFGPSTIVSDSNTIYTTNGWYDTKLDQAQLLDRSKIITRKQELTGDTLFYNRKTGEGEAFCNIVLLDTANKMGLEGGYAYYNEKTEDALIYDLPVLSKFFDDDTLFLHADTVRSNLDSTGENNIVRAYNHVKFYKEDLQGKCDSLTYIQADSMLHMFSEPVLWSDENQITARLIQVKTTKKGISRLFLKKDAFVVARSDKTEFNQVKGKNMTGYFSKNELRQIKVIGNGQAVYYVKEEKLNEDSVLVVEKKGVTDAICSEIVVKLKDSKLTRVSFLEKPKTVFHPMNQLPPEPMILDGFSWEIKHRPLSKEDIFNWYDPNLDRPTQTGVTTTNDSIAAPTNLPLSEKEE